MIVDHKYDQALALLFEYDANSVHSELHRVFSAKNLYADLFDNTSKLPEWRREFEYWTDGKVLAIDKQIFDKDEELYAYIKDLD